MKYNWHTFSKVLRILGFQQIPTQTHGYLYFNHTIFQKITLVKKDKYTDGELIKYLSVMKLPLPYFERIYNKCKE